MRPSQKTGYGCNGKGFRNKGAWHNGLELRAVLLARFFKRVFGFLQEEVRAKQNDIPGEVCFAALRLGIVLMEFGANCAL